MSSPRRTIMAASGGGGFPEGAMYEVGLYTLVESWGNTAPWAQHTWTQVGTDIDWAGTSSYGYNFIKFVKSDNTLWGVGNNTSGELGDGTAVTKSSPVQIGTGTDWAKTDKKIAAGGTHSVMIKTNGQLWASGTNWKGHLGDGTTTSRSSPVQISSPALSWSAAAAADRHTTVISTAGTIWTTGFNLNGCLGLGDTTDRSNLTQIGSGSDWSKVANGDAFSLAVKTNGTLWAWGSNSQGRLGVGDTTNRSSPVQVGGASDNNWADVFASGQTGMSIALKTDGTLWAWGQNYTGQLGHGNTTDLSSPVQIGFDTNWLRVSNSNNNCMAVKTNGEVWAWGLNNYGQLGLGDTTTRTSPVKVPDFVDIHDAGIAYATSRIIV